MIQNTINFSFEDSVKISQFSPLTFVDLAEIDDNLLVLWNKLPMFDICCVKQSFTGDG